MKLADAQPTERSAIERAVDTELTRQLYGAPGLHLIPAFVALMTAILLWPLFPHWMTTFWIGGSLAAAAARMLLSVAFRLNRPDEEAIGAWATAFAVGAGASGLVWGLLAAAILITRDSSVLVFVAFVIGGLAAGATVLDSKSMPAFYAFMTPTVLPTVAALFSRGGPKMIEMAVILVTFLVFLVLMARENHSQRAADIRRQLQLDSLNTDLEQASLRLASEVAERIKVSESLANANLRLEAISHNAPDAIVISDSQARVSAWNPAAERMFGYAAAEVIGRPLHDVVTPERMRERAAAGFSRFAATSDGAMLGRVTSLVALRKDGSEFPIDLSLSAMSVGGEIHALGIARDTTDRKVAEAALRDEQTLFQRLVEQNTSGISITTEDGEFNYINPRGLEMIGLAHPGALIGRPALDFVADSDRRAVGIASQTLFGGRETFVEMELTLLSSEGAEVATLAQCTIATFRGVRGMLTVVTDITERKRSQDRIARLNAEMSAALVTLRQHERDLTMTAKFSDLLQSCRTTAEAYPIIAAAAKALFSEAAGALARMDRGDVHLVRVSTWGERSRVVDSFAPEDCWALRSGHRHESLGPDDGPHCAHFAEPPDGPYICLPLTVRGETRGLLTLLPPLGSVIDDDLRQRMLTFGDVIKLSLSNLSLLETLAEQAMSDQLTGLYNRRHLAETLPRDIRRAQRRSAPLTVAMLDVDHFKAFNDAYGHDAGDLVLSQLAAFLKDSLRAGDVACRYGGEEFLLVLPDCESAAARARLARIAGVLKDRTFAFDGALLPGVTLSIGLAEVCEALPSADLLIKAADEALYLAKARGRDSIEVWQPPTARRDPS